MRQSGSGVQPIKQRTEVSETGTGYQVALDPVAGALIGPATGPTVDRVLLFAGHMIDKPSRAQPRFPAVQEATARRAIRAAIAQAQACWPAGTSALGIAGGANGGDILFHAHGVNEADGRPQRAAAAEQKRFFSGCRAHGFQRAAQRLGAGYRSVGPACVQS